MLSFAWARAALVSVAGAVLATCTLRADAVLHPNDHLALCGDAMTTGRYSNFIEDYLLECQSIPGLAIKQYGWSAGSPAGFLARLQPDLLPDKPTVVTLLYNFDGGGRPLDPAALEARRHDESQLIDALKMAGVRKIILGSPPCVDATRYHHDATQAAIENQTLRAVSAMDQKVAERAGVLYADVFSVTWMAMNQAKGKLGSDFAFAGEGTGQPEESCSVAMACAFLKALRIEGDAGTVEVNFTPGFVIGKSTAFGGPTLVSSGEQILTVQAPRYTFAFPGHPTSDLLPSPFMACLPFYQEFDRLRLVVKGLPTAMAKVYWNDKSADFSTEDLAKGIILPTYLESPFRGPCEDLDRKVVDQQNAESVAGAAAMAGTPNAQAAKQAAAGQAEAESCVKPTPFTIRVVPLASPEARPPGPVNIIVDTDMNGDCDDAGAVALLNDFMCLGEATILACNVNTHDADKSSGATVQAINAYYGHLHIPIGACYDTNEPTVHSFYTLAIRKQFAPAFPPDDQLPHGVDVYRHALASAADGSVVICSLGWMENLADLLKSGPDAASPLAGPELVKKKVRHMVVMGNTNPNDIWVVPHWPTPILWTTDIGNYVYPGKSLTTTPADNPVRIIYKLNGSEGGRQGWDPTAAWLAVRGPGELWDVITGGYWRVNVPPAQYGTWVNGPVTNMTMATIRMPSPEVLKLIDAELARLPCAVTKNPPVP